MPITNEMVLRLEDFKYDISFDLNMVYYHIWLIKNASNICIIILPWGKRRYKRLPIGYRKLKDTLK